MSARAGARGARVRPAPLRAARRRVSSSGAIAAARVIHHLVREQLSRQPRYWRSPEDTATQCVLEDMARVAAQGEDS